MWTRVNGHNFALVKSFSSKRLLNNKILVNFATEWTHACYEYPD